MTVTVVALHPSPHHHLAFAHLRTTSWRSRSCSIIHNRCQHDGDDVAVAVSRRSYSNGGNNTFKRKRLAVWRGETIRCWKLQQQQQNDDDNDIDTDTAANTASTPTVKTNVITTSTTVKSQAALIAGTAIGGGFLALPAAPAPCGARPAALGLCGVWLFLLGGSLSLSNAIFGLKKKRSFKTTKQGEIYDDFLHLKSVPVVNNTSCMLGEIDVDDDDDDTLRSLTPLSLSSLIRECYGNAAGFFTGIAFLSLIVLTLVAQLSKVGSMLGKAFPHVDFRFTTVCFTITMIALCSLCTGRKVERVNTVLTSVMLASFVSVVGLAAGSGRWSVDALKRADYSLLLPTYFLSSSTSSATSESPSSMSSSMGSCSPWAIPIFIQLLVYNEVVPLVASRLQDEAKVRQAIIIGSSLPLFMCLIWSCVSLGLVPYEPLHHTVIAAASSSGRMYSYDPLNKLLGASSMGGIIGKLFSMSVNVLANSAICTTVIGCILASAQYFEDSMQNKTTVTRASVGNNKATNNVTKNLYRKIGTHALAIVPSAIIAIYGTNRDLYYRAIRLAGAGPVTVLYGLLPPLCNLRLCWNRLEDVRGRIHVASQIMLVMMSMAILIASHISK